MHDQMRRVVVIALSLAAMAGASATFAQAPAQLYEAAKKEGVVYWYTGLLQNQIVKPAASAFEKKYPGVRVEIVGGSDTELLDKINDEIKVGKLQADVIDGPSMASQVIKAGRAAPFKPASSDNVAALNKDPNGLWIAPALFFLTASVNTDLVKPEEEPKTLEDLLNPKWKGKMAWAGEIGTAGQAGFIGAILDQLGETKGMAYLNKLAAQQITTVPSNARVVMDKVIAGESEIGLGTYNHHAARSKTQGAPIKSIMLEPIVATMPRLTLLKDAPHPNGAKLLIDYLMSAEGQQLFSDAGYIPAASNVQAKDPSLKLDPAKHKLFSPTPQQELQHLDRWIELYRDKFQ